MKRVLKVGSHRIPYELSFTDRRRLRIVVEADGRVVVGAPAGRACEEVEARLGKRAGWILKQRRTVEKYKPIPPPKRYVSGETFRYLGRQYRLKVVTGSEDRVALKEGRLKVWSSRGSDPPVVRTLVDRWYRGHAEGVFTRRLEACHQIARRHGMPHPTFSMRKMKRRWGSCVGEGRLVLNPELVKAPRPCIDYVIMHELCHLKERHHGKTFYALLSRCMPDWQERKNRLALFHPDG